MKSLLQAKIIFSSNFISLQNDMNLFLRVIHPEDFISIKYQYDVEICSVVIIYKAKI